MIGERLNFEKKVNIINIDEVKKILDERVEVETITNFLYTISQISLSFKEAIESEDRNRITELYEKIIIDYSGSLYVVEARKRFRKLRGDVIN